MPTTHVNNIDMYYEVHGEGEPLVLIAGFSADHTVWQPVVDLFARRFQVYVFDNRGSGQTTSTEGEYTIEQMSEDVIALCEKLSIPKAHFVGSSMGGCILQALLYYHPERVKTATISNSFSHPGSTFGFYLQAQLELMKAGAPKRALALASLSWAFSYQFLTQPDMLESLVELKVNYPYPTTIEGYTGQLFALKNYNSESWLPKIKLPVLVIGADQDLIFSEQSTRQLSEKITDAEYVVIPNCGHIPHFEYPELFVSTVENFIELRKLND